MTAGAPGSPTPSTIETCNAAETDQVVQRFIDSFDRGNIRELDQLVAGADLFQWYSTDPPGQRIDPGARDRDSLIAYFEKRHEEHERLLLKSFSFNGTSAGFGNFGFELLRSADDGLPQHLMSARAPLTAAGPHGRWWSGQWRASQSVRPESPWPS